MTPERREDLPELTSLRFVAAFGVLLLHYRDLLGPLPPWLMKAVVGGQYGVTFFFVLSGFVLTWRYAGWFSGGVDDARYWRFLRFRVARLYPVYVLGLLLDTPWHLIERARAGSLAEVGPTWWASWLLNLVGLQAWVPAVPFAMFWNTPAWSVAAEFFFYACFPFACAALAARGRGTVRCALLMGAALLGGVALYALVLHAMNFVWRVGEQAQYIVLAYNPLLRGSEFLAGCVAGRWFVDGGAGVARLAGSRRLRDALVVLGLAAVAARVAMPDYTGPSAALWLVDVSVKYAAFVLPFALLIVAVAAGRTLLSGWLALPWMVALGEASYALYILHWPVRSVLLLSPFGGLHGPVLHAAFLLATVGASLLCHRGFERPWRDRLRGPAAQSAGGTTGNPRRTHSDMPPST